MNAGLSKFINLPEHVADARVLLPTRQLMNMGFFVGTWDFTWISLTNSPRDRRRHGGAGEGPPGPPLHHLLPQQPQHGMAHFKGRTWTKLKDGEVAAVFARIFMHIQFSAVPCWPTVSSASAISNCSRMHGFAHAAHGCCSRLLKQHLPSSLVMGVARESNAWRRKIHLEL